MARHATITSLSFVAQGAATTGEALEQALSCIDLAAHDRPDLIVLPEAFVADNEYCRRSPNGFCASAEPLDGPTLTALAGRASRHETYIVAPMILERKSGRTNSIVLLDRRGEVRAIYDKAYPTIFELEQGRDIRPGNGPVTIETDLGKIGLLVCFDINFDSLRESYREDGVDLLIFCSMFPGGSLLRSWAMLNGCYVVSAVPNTDSMVVNPMGRVLARSSSPNNRVLTARLNLDYVVLHLDYNQRLLNELRRRYGAAIDLEIHESEGRAVLTSLDPGATSADICRAIDLEPIRAFFSRSLAACQQANQSGPLPPSTLPW